jgi:hypothetical protein
MPMPSSVRKRNSNKKLVSGWSGSSAPVLDVAVSGAQGRSC